MTTNNMLKNLAWDTGEGRWSVVFREIPVSPFKNRGNKGCGPIGRNLASLQ